MPNFYHPVKIGTRTFAAGPPDGGVPHCFDEHSFGERPAGQ
jgi:hypothetical protein